MRYSFRSAEGLNPSRLGRTTPDETCLLLSVCLKSANMHRQLLLRNVARSLFMWSEVIHGGGDSRPEALLSASPSRLSY